MVMQFLTSVLNNLNADGIPICALAAERCNCSCRALKWLETFGMKNDPKTPCGVSFNKEQFYFLEVCISSSARMRNTRGFQKLYTRLEDVDGVVGTFGSIERHVYPSPREQILLFEMCGNYADALPLYQSLQDEKVANCKTSRTFALQQSFPIMSFSCLWSSVFFVSTSHPWHLPTWSHC